MNTHAQPIEGAGCRAKAGAELGWYSRAPRKPRARAELLPSPFLQ